MTQNKFDLNTMIPISILGVVIGGSVWLGTMHSSITAATINIRSINSEIAKYRIAIFENQRQLESRLSKIEGKIDFLVKETKK